MDFQECIKFANEHPVCYLATAQGRQPHVRPLGMWFADERGFFFQTESVKALCKQLHANNKVELCFYAPGPNIGTMLRVVGKVEWVEDLALRAKVLEERAFLKAAGVTGPEDPLLAVFCVSSGEAYFWTMAQNMQESEIERIKF